jgi:hypothetical protein
MSAQHFTIRINLDALRGQLARSLQRTILLVAAGLQNIDQLDPEFLELPVSFKMILDPNMKWTKESLKDIIANGFCPTGFAMR